ncbi:Golgi-associated PDZ and coiled-coil motif-containing protein isoform X1 [Hydra vulgaris]|uniref:Golgi-associated PDZ and coiled-coil motif-containing protein n=1 Tax=Hydra vulgaris TaxID=6087 RepID=T2M5L1_HYDVU|nr:Golgi-associated PDZ and coiled-coil motif-containing protein [Hydra vulgaris]
MSLAVSMFRWLDMLEKEFDKAFVELDSILGYIDYDDGNFIDDGRKKLAILSSVFSQLSHKSQTIFENNAKYEAELIGLRTELSEAKATVTILEKEVKNSLLQLHSVQLQLHSKGENSADLQIIKTKLENDLTQFRQNAIKESQVTEEIKIIKKENDALRKYITQIQGEVCGARLAAKYLEKELAGRIQQIQLLGRNLKLQEHEMLWNQIESEIFLHRHKTVIRACKKNPPKKSSSSSHINKEKQERVNIAKHSGDKIVVKFYREKSEGLGISITGGKEHGIPVIISEIHEGMLASRCEDLQTGDAILAVNNINLENVSHEEAVSILSALSGNVTMEVWRVIDTSSEDEEWETNYNSRYSTVGLLDDPNEISLDSDINMTNSPAPNSNKKNVNISSLRSSLAELKLAQSLRKINKDMSPADEASPQPTHI